MEKLRKDLDTATEALEEQSDYVELKRELTVLRSIEFQGVVTDIENKPLESLLLEKLKGM